MTQKLLTLLAAWLIAGVAHALTLAPVKIAPDVYAFIGETGGRTNINYGMNANTGFIVTNAGVVVVDSGSGYLAAKAIHQAIKAVTSQPVRYVINTGGQDHRWLGNGYFKEQGAQIIAARPALADMQERGGMLLAGLKDVDVEMMANTVPTYPEKLFDKQETLRLGGVEIHLLYFYGGHTPGDSVVWLPQSQVLFSGDLVYVDRLLGVLPFSNTKNWLASFAEMEKLKPETIVPGHGQPCSLDKARSETRDYLILLREHMKKAIGEMTDLQGAMDSLDQEGYAYLRNYGELKGGNASRTYLEIEAE
ncbi:MAG: MBL fold metallo-hydrolase [Betaproteobacteria bacterium]|nr:MBL fold metallo-hydrolase [Betaproteobacteria bacterium]